MFERNLVIPLTTIRIARLSEKTPKDPEEIMTWLNEGNSRRTQHPTDANAQSSRSHAVFVVKLKKQEGAKIINSKLGFQILLHRIRII